jgi:signal transduction histidine kinase
VSRGTTSNRRLESLALEGAERRVRSDLAATAEPRRRVPGWLVLAAALALFMGGFVLRLSVDDAGALIANFYTVPIAMLAMVFGVRAALAAAAFATLLVWVWGQFESQYVGLLGYSTRATVFVLVGGLVGYYAERLRNDIAERRQAETELAVRADDLAVSNAELSLAVTRLEAFAEIARAVGGETELRTVLELILEHGREILDARTMAVYLEEDGVLVAAAVTDDALSGLPERAESTEALIASALAAVAREGRAADPESPAALVVRLRWKGESLGALVALEPREGPAFREESEELMGSVAASAATAVATAKSVAENRLRDAIEASEEARARWARELHDETLQGLVGLRMRLASARRSASPEQVEAALSDALEQTHREILNLRSLIAELRPAALDELGLGAAIETLSERSAAAAGLDVETSVGLRDNGAPRLARETETTVYRLVQEALTNAARHSGGTRVRVEVAELEELIDVAVTDDGHGFDPAATTPGFGLRGMRERVQLAGGSMRIDSSEAGSVVRARLPAQRPRDGQTG